MIRRFRIATADNLAARSARRHQSIDDQAAELTRFVKANSTIKIDANTAREAVRSLATNRLSIAIADLQYDLAELIRPTREGSLHDDPRG